MILSSTDCGLGLYHGNISFLAALNLQSSISPKEGKQKGQHFAQMQSSNGFFHWIQSLGLARACASHDTKYRSSNRGLQALGRKIDTWRGRERLRWGLYRVLLSCSSYISTQKALSSHIAKLAECFQVRSEVTHCIPDLLNHVPKCGIRTLGFSHAS